MAQVLLNNVLMNNNEKIKESMKNLLKLFQRKGILIPVMKIKLIK